MEIWIIDDNEIDQIIASKMIESILHSITVKCYSTALEALKNLSDISEGNLVILLDVDMPVLTGWDFLDALDKRILSIPIYIISSSEKEKDRKKARESILVKGFFGKPISEKSILKIAVDNCLGHN